MKGLKMRIPGVGGQVWARLGAVPQAIPGGEIYPALEKGTIDAAEWVGPYDDEKLGFYKVAKHYYYPGWWEPGPVIHFFVNKQQWDKLPKAYQAAWEAAAYEANVNMMAEYDHKNPIALAKLLGAGVKLHKYSPEIMKAAYKAATELYADESAKNPAFKKVYTEMEKYRKTQNAWFSVAEASMDGFLQSAK
jgi:TRAP-type mannitol/chloroaromatic compound transport system substrate-binding protein